MFLSITVLAVPIVLDLNKTVPSSGEPSKNSTSPAVPPDVTEKPLSLVLPPKTACAHKDPEPTVMLPAN